MIARAPLRPSASLVLGDALRGAVELIAMTFPVGDLHVLEAGGGSIAALRHLSGARFSAADLEAVEAASGYQVVVCPGIERLPDPRAALARLRGALAPDGLLMVAGAPAAMRRLIGSCGLSLAYEAAGEVQDLGRALSARVAGLGRALLGGASAPERVLLFQRA